MCSHDGMTDGRTRYDRVACRLIHEVVCQCGAVVAVVSSVSYTPEPIILDDGSIVARVDVPRASLDMSQH